MGILKTKKKTKLEAGERRYKILTISEELFLDIFRGTHKTGYKVIKDGLPLDARIRNVRYWFPDKIELLIESKKFPSVKEMDKVPQIEPIFEELKK